MRELCDREFDVFRLDRHQYEPVPWSQLRDAVARADGAVVFGFRQLHVVEGEWRPGTTEAGPAAEWYPTSWNQIEAGMAIMAGVPTLVTCDVEVTDGVFSPDTFGDCVFGFLPHSDPSVRKKALERWTAAVCARASRTIDD